MLHSVSGPPEDRAHNLGGLLQQHQADANGSAWQGASSNLNVIFALFVVMYGGIGALWAGKYYMEKRGSSWVTSVQVPLICITWASTSIGMTVLNKTLVTVLHAPAMVSAFQMLVGFVIFLAYTLYHRSILAEVTAKQLRWWLVVPVLFSAIVCSAALSFEYISLSFQTVVRNTAPLIVLPIERMVMPAGRGPVVTPASFVAFAMMLWGAVVYARAIDNLSTIGVVAAVVNMIIAVCDRITQRRLLTIECSGLPSVVCALVNNGFGLIPTIGMIAANHEVGGARVNAGWHDPRVWMLLVLSGMVGLGICYVGFECQRLISATSFFVLQNTTKIGIVVIGVLLFGDPIRSQWIVLGLCMSFAGSMVYGKSQMDAKADQEKERLIPKSDAGKGRQGSNVKV